MEKSNEKASNDYKQKFIDVTNDMIQLNQQLDGLKKEKEALKKNLEKVKHIFFFFKQTKTKFSDHKSENVRSSVFLIRSNARFRNRNNLI